jgi:hypothetical protein
MAHIIIIIITYADRNFSGPLYFSSDTKGAEAAVNLDSVTVLHSEHRGARIQNGVVITINDARAPEKHFI